MNPIDLASHSRRAFLGRMAQLAAVGAATPLGLNLAAMGEAAASRHLTTRRSSASLGSRLSQSPRMLLGDFTAGTERK